MNLEPLIFKIKKIVSEKGELNRFPKNQVEAVVIQEQHIKSSYSFSIAIGKIQSNQSTSRYFDIRGKIFNDTFNIFSDGNLRIEPKMTATTKGLEYICAIFEPGLIRAVDEASWDNKFSSLTDFINVLENLGKNSITSLLGNFEKLET